MKRLGMSVFLLAMSSAALADDPAQGRVLTLQELQEKCMELSSNEQIKPFKADISCSQVSYSWREINPAQVTLPNSREVGGSITMKEFSTPYQGGLVPAGETQAACTVLAEVRESVSGIVVPVSCEELNQIQDLTQFCTPHLDALVAEDPGAVQSEETGKVFNTCAGKAGQDLK